MQSGAGWPRDMGRNEVAGSGLPWDFGRMLVLLHEIGEGVAPPQLSGQVARQLVALRGYVANLETELERLEDFCQRRHGAYWRQQMGKELDQGEESLEES